MSSGFSFGSHQTELLAGVSIEDLDDHIADIFTKPAARASLGTWHHEAMMNVFESNVLSLDKDCKEWLKKASAERETRKEALDGNSACE